MSVQSQRPHALPGKKSDQKLALKDAVKDANDKPEKKESESLDFYIGNKNNYENEGHEGGGEDQGSGGEDHNKLSLAILQI